MVQKSSLRHARSRVNILVPGMELSHVGRGTKAHLSVSVPSFQIPEYGFPALACREQIPSAFRPAEERNALIVPSHLSGDAHCLQIPDNDGSIYSPRGKVVALAVKAQHRCMAGPDRAGHALRIVLEEVVIGKKEIHRRGNRAGASREWQSGMVDGRTRQGCEELQTAEPRRVSVLQG
jgi:hypothetical protein